MNSSLPFSREGRRILLAVLILGLWAPFKIVWEQQITHQQDILRYHGTTMTRQLRDELGQGLTIGVLSGMRSVVADLIWLNVTLAWENEEWFKMGGYINLCTALQPRAVTFWDLGGWQLAWNASVAAAHDRKQPNELRRIKASRFWIDKGLDIYKRGIENNPEYWRLWSDTALLYQQRLAENELRSGQLAAASRDYRTAAYYYQKANELPNAPVFLERFPAIMYRNAGDDEAAYAAWAALWERLTPAQRAQRQHWAGERNAAVIRQLEEKLSIPEEKRIFPN